MIIKKSSVYFKIFVCLLYSLVYVSIPWEGLYGYFSNSYFVDKLNYYSYFENGLNILEYKEFSGFFSYVSNEFAWHYGVRFFHETLGLSLDAIFTAISFISIFFSAYLVFRKFGFYALLLLINPLVVDFAFSQFRLALSISFLMLAFLSMHKRGVAISLVLCSLFIHTASLIFIFIGFVVVLSRERLFTLKSKEFLFLFLFLCGCFISLLIGPLREIVLGAIGDRRAEYTEISSGILYSVFWAFLLIPIFLQRKFILLEDEVRYSIVIISIVFFNMLHGGYSTRFLSATFPFLIITMFSFKGVYRFVFIALLIVYMIFQWVYWFKI